MRVGLPAWRLLSPPGGVGNVLLALLEQYRELAPEDEFLTYHEAPEPKLPHGPNLVARRLRVPLGENNVTWNSLALPWAVRRDRVDLVHNLGYVLVPNLGRPAVVTIHDVSYARYPEWYPRRAGAWLRHGTRCAVRRAAALVTDSEFSAREIAELYAVPPERIEVVPLAAHARFRVLDDVTDVRRRYDLPERFVLYLGGIHERRRADLLVEACAQVLATRDAELVVAGPNRDAAYDLAAHAERLGLGRRVRLLGYVPDDDLPGLYNAATCFAWPSVYEGFGLPPLEALACGTPTVVADASSLPEVVGEAALRVPPGDAEALGAALARLLDDQALHDDLRRRGPEQAATFSWRRAAEAMLAIYRRVLQERR